MITCTSGVDGNITIAINKIVNIYANETIIKQFLEMQLRITVKLIL